jgi:hypothetical protein
MIIYAYRQKSNPQLFSFGSIIAVRLAAALFVAFSAQKDALTAALTALNVVLADPKSSATEKEAVRNRVLGILDLLAPAIEVFAQGDDAIESASGFDIRKTSVTKITSVNVPSNFMVLNTDRTSEVRGSWKTVEGAVNYALEYRVKNETVWHNGYFTSKREILMSGFEPGTYIEFRLCALGRGELKSDWTPIIGVWIA